MSIIWTWNQAFVCIALATQITNTNKSLAPLSQQIEKALSRGWMGSPEKRETPFYNLKRIYKYDVDHNSGFNKKPLERFRDSIIDNSANPVSIKVGDTIAKFSPYLINETSSPGFGPVLQD